MLTNGRIMIATVLLLCFMLPGCLANMNSIYREFKIEKDKPTSVSIDVNQRVVLTGRSRNFRQPYSDNALSTSLKEYRMRQAMESVVLSAALFTSGCAVQYFDPDTQTEHVWGIGHMKMKFVLPSEGLQAVVHGTDVVGASFGKADKHGYFTLGWQRLEFIDIVKESTAIRLEWPTSDFMNVRVGSKFPNTNISPFEFESESRTLPRSLESNNGNSK